MSLRRQLRALAMRCATALRLDEAALSWRRGARVQVVNFHGTPAGSAGSLRAQLEWVRERFDVRGLEDFGRIREGGQALRRPAVLLTFDDGLASNYHVAAPLLESLGLRGVFFINPGFAEQPGEAARDFFLARLAEDPWRACTPEDWTPMSPGQVADLARRGHAVGNHTWSHADLSRTRAADLHREIVASRDRLRQWTGAPVDAFAWTYRWDAITPAAWSIARAAHRWCFAPCAGVVRAGAGLLAGPLWRTHVEGNYRAWEYRFLYSGLAGIPARARRRRLRASLLPRAAGGEE